MGILISFVQPDGTVQEVKAAQSTSVMRAALEAGVDGIAGDCGGDCSCATCHVYVDAQFLPLFDPPSEIECEMLEGTASERLPNSRLACQLSVTPAIAGLRVTVPDRQF